MIAKLKAEKSEGYIDIEYFQSFTKDFNNLFRPCISLQIKLREKICGKSFWDKISNRTYTLNEKRKIPVSQFMSIVSVYSLLTFLIQQLIPFSITNKYKY